MKKELKIILGIVLGVCLLVLLSTSVYSGLMKNNNSEKTNTEKNKKLWCEKKETQENVNITSKYIMNIEANDAIKTYKNIFIFEYSDEEFYKSAKESKREDDAILTYDDNLKQVTLTYENAKVLDSEGEEVSVWYVEYKNVLEKEGYKCEIK